MIIKVIYSKTHAKYKIQNNHQVKLSRAQKNMQKYNNGTIRGYPLIN